MIIALKIKFYYIAVSGLQKEETKELVIEPQIIINKEKSSSGITGKTTKQLRDEINQRKQALRDVTRMQASSKIGVVKHVNYARIIVFRHYRSKVNLEIVIKIMSF